MKVPLRHHHFVSRPRAQSAAWILSLVAATTAASSTSIVGCSSAPEIAPRDEAVGATAQAVGGIEGTFEYALDAPWRIEPRMVHNMPVYDPIPIQMTIHDADQIGDDYQDMDTPPSIGDVCSLTVTEGPISTAVTPPVPPKTYTPPMFDEIERSLGDWKYPGADQPSGPVHQECIRTATYTCGGLAGTNGTSEWHAVATYAAQNARPGADVPLTLQMRVARSPGYPCSADTGDLFDKHFYTLVNYVRVHYGEASLPRFGSEWAYGDVHYHSQGTDNEGESGYNYRGVSRAMRSIGLDFAFATEHASDSEQFMDVDIRREGERIAVRSKRGVLRDMDRRRFAAMKGLADRTNGDAARATSTQGATGPVVTPQIWVGGEVDVVPETVRALNGPMPASVPYGDHKSYAISTLCGGWEDKLVGRPLSQCAPGADRCYEWFLTDQAGCDTTRMTSAMGPIDVLINDVQGLNEYAVGREHMVYLPDPDAADPFVSSSTGLYGGAQRRLATTATATSGATLPPMLPEVEQKHGALFLAHHLNAPQSADEGPDAPPWSPSMLDKAWRSSAVLGLEFWNEDIHLKSHVSAYVLPTAGQPPAPQQTYEYGYERDSTILYGRKDVELVDGERYSLTNDSAGYFSLVPFDVTNGAYDEWSDGLESILTDGMVSWDALNLRGLDMNQTMFLTWLPRGEPRRMFMAGGSDAHGDFNYRRAGYMRGTDEVNDARIGSPRNLVHVGPKSTTVVPNTPAVFGQGDTLDALKAGHFAVTDGAAIRIVVDANRNGVIDDTDPQMGDYAVLPSQSTLPILVEFESTPEFGEVRSLSLTVGALDTTTGSHRLYEGNVGIWSEQPGTVHVEVIGEWQYTLGTRGYWRIDRAGLPAGSLTNDPMLFAQYPEDGTVMHRVQAFDIDLDRLRLDGGHRPDRLFVRALAAGHRAIGADCSSATTLDARLGRCIRRYAFTNPVWVNEGTPLPPSPNAPPGSIVLAP